MFNCSFYCEKINLSLIHDTLTIYTKKIGTFREEAFLLEGSISIICRPCYYVEDDHPVFDCEILQDLGLEEFLSADDTDHDIYHQDSFDNEDEHYHLKFDSPISEETFAQLLSVFIRFNLITEEEKRYCLLNYHLSHQIDSHSIELSPLLPVPNDAEEKNELSPFSMRVHTITTSIISELETNQSDHATNNRTRFFNEPHNRRNLRTRIYSPTANVENAYIDASENLDANWASSP